MDYKSKILNLEHFKYFNVNQNGKNVGCFGLSILEDFENHHKILYCGDIRGTKKFILKELKKLLIKYAKELNCKYIQINSDRENINKILEKLNFFEVEKIYNLRVEEK